MSYVIYHKDTTKILQAPAQSVGCYIDSYKSESAAKAALTRLDNKGKLGSKVETVPDTHPSGYATSQRIETPYVKEDFAIAEARDFYENIEKKRKVRNSMTGQEVEESVNTPYSCSVASDAYWQN